MQAKKLITGTIEIRQRYIEKMDEQAAKLSQETLDEVESKNWDKILKGRKKFSVKTVKPEGDYVAGFVWRMVRFHAGIDSCMPVMAEVCLDAYCREKGWNYSETSAYLDSFAFVKAIETVGFDAFKGIAAWRYAL